MAATKPTKLKAKTSSKLSKPEQKDFDQALREVGEVDGALLKKVTAKDHYELETPKGTQRLSKLFRSRELLLGALSEGSELVSDGQALRMMTLELYGDLLREAAYPLLRRWLKRTTRCDAGTQYALRGLSFSSHSQDAKLILATLKRCAPTRGDKAKDAYLFSAGAVSLERLETSGLGRLILRELAPIAKKPRPAFADLAFVELLCLSLLTHQQAEIWPELGVLARNAKSHAVARILGEYTLKCQVADAVEAYLPRALETGHVEHVASLLDLPNGCAVFEGVTQELEPEERAEWELTLLHQLYEREDFTAIIQAEPGWLTIAERVSVLEQEITQGRAQLKATQVLERSGGTKSKKSPSRKPAPKKPASKKPASKKAPRS